MQPDIFPYKEYIQRANYGYNWVGNLLNFLVVNNLTLEEYKQRIADNFEAMGRPQDAQEDFDRCMKINSTNNLSHDDAFILVHLYLYLYVA